MIPEAKVLASNYEILNRLGADISEAHIFGLKHGFESAIQKEVESFGVSIEIEEKISVILEDIEAGTQSPHSRSLYFRLEGDGIQVSEAKVVMEYLKLQGRYEPEIALVANAPGSRFSRLR